MNFICSCITYVSLSYDLVQCISSYYLDSLVFLSQKINALIIVQIHERLNLLNKKY